MTGYGKAEVLLEGGKLTVEFRSVNGKNAEISLKTSLLPKDKEMPLRSRIAERLQRGTIDMFLTWEPNVAGSAAAINRSLALDYYRQIGALASEIGAPDHRESDSNYILSSLLRLPDVVSAGKQSVIDENNWPLVEAAIEKAHVDAENMVKAAEEKKDKVIDYIVERIVRSGVNS